MAFLHEVGVCIVSGVRGPIEAHHVQINDALFGASFGVALKQFDHFTLPLSQAAHRDRHLTGGEREFWNRNGFPAFDIGRGPLAAAMVLTGFWCVGDVAGARRWVLERAREATAARAAKG